MKYESGVDCTTLHLQTVFLLKEIDSEKYLLAK
jgi:hypothetical protein